ncbi:MAG: isoleucyl-tRNA synthetase [Patescibacteria group bacterium]|nr:isoleucyl-tRNA synthetase [Patescibacteria group bacterium]
MFKKVDPKMSLPKMEEDIIKFWEENKIFEKSVENRDKENPYVFYDGPPFATGTPHYGHIVASTMKDVVPRYWTMKGYRVERKWGWDCHGLPIENIVEKELGSKTKKDIKKLGVDKFNELCRSKVLGYVDEWKKVITRLGRWADMENAYKTMDLPFMESVWWVFKQLWDKGLIYESYRSMHICPRCETTLSQSEVAEGYKDVKDLSVIAKFELVDEPGTYVLAWTTTPWTLIGNAALAVGEGIKYKVVSIKQDENKYIVAADRLEDVLKDKEYEIVSEIAGKDLIGKSYKPLFDYYVVGAVHEPPLQNRENAAPATRSRSEGGRGWKIYAGDFVTTEEGTGVVHIAPAFGEDDMNLGKKYDLPFIQHVGMDGVIKPEAGEFAGLHVKPIEDTQKTDVEIIKYLAKNNLLFSKEKYEHSYPHCWRCDTPLLNYATTSWFVSVEKIKERMLELAEDINWSPAHIKNGRWGNWLEGARDWSISRQRFWASVMPIWRCDCGEMKVFGSVSELEELSGEKITDIHKHIVDKITFKCEKCDGAMKRVADVLDTWFDSGSMPYAQTHYPFENKEKFEAGFPAQFIAEGIDQTRAWFYYLHVIASGIKDNRAFSNVVVNGIVLAEDGQKMAKRLKNYPDPMYMLEKYGADSLRYYLTASPVMQAVDLNFKESDVADITRGMMRMLWNSYSFFVLYANIDGFKPSGNSVGAVHEPPLLDRWIVSELQLLIKEINLNMEAYELTRASRLFPKFIDNLSNWYIRRSRKRFWKSENDTDKNEAYETLHYVLVTLAKVMAPFTPFVAEEIWGNLTNYESGTNVRITNNPESVHLCDFPMADEKLIDEKLNKNMSDLREIISLGLQERAKHGIKVRQPLARVILGQKFSGVFNELINKPEWSIILTEELNVKGAELGTDVELVGLDLEITEDLRLEGAAREVIRHIQEMRKEAGYEVDNRIQVCYSPQSVVFQKFGDLIAKETLADKLKYVEKSEDFDLQKEFVIEGQKLLINIKK